MPTSPSLLPLSLPLPNNNYLKLIDVNRHCLKLEPPYHRMVIPSLEPLSITAFHILPNSQPPPSLLLPKKVNLRRNDHRSKPNSNEPTLPLHLISPRMMKQFLNLPRPSLLNSPGRLPQPHLLRSWNYLRCHRSRCRLGILPRKRSSRT